MKKYDFGGWATKNDLRCSDGRIILKNAFKENDGATVPLVWNHQHNDPENILGHALLENRDEGVYTYCTFNDTESGRKSKMLVEHGDICALSIHASGLKQQGNNVLHGKINEVSLVLAGANPGASIDSILAHGEESEDEAIIYTGEEISFSHSNEGEEDNEVSEKKEDDDKDETIADVFETLTDKQKEVVYGMIGEALGDSSETKDDEEDESDDDKIQHNEGGNETMKHNVFDNEETNRADVLCHADQEDIIKMAKSTQVGSFQAALQMYADENNLQHNAVSGGFAEGDVSTLFPEYKEVRPGAPELITNDQGWISTVMSKVHKSPISRIRTTQADIRSIEALRAKGYTKGHEKKLSGNIKLVRRSTDPQTVYVKNALHRDDIIDITDFDYVQYLYNIDRMQLNEELAMAIMLGDGRDDGDEDKISPDHIRPIWTDNDLYTIHTDVDFAKAKSELQGTNTDLNFGKNYIYAEAIIETVLHAREKYKGTGTPDFYCTPYLLNVMLLARDINGRRIYNSKAELASSLNVGNIITAEQFEGKTRTDSKNKEKKLLGIVVNMNDYSLGATKGGELTHFTQFDIDFNQQKSLLETRCSGALNRVYSAIAIEEPLASDASGS